MEICMKDTLRRLRKEKDVTQEELAASLGISSQSVSKWERGEGFPDITLLPNIALFFGVTVDELLNVSQARIEEKVKAYQEESHHYWHIGDTAKNLELWERAYTEFPNDCRVMYGLMDALNPDAAWPCPEEDAKRIFALGERILDESKDTNLRESAIQTLCYTYDSIGDKENALRYADMGGDIWTTRQELRAFVLPGEEGVEAGQQYIVALLRQAAMAASTISTKVSFTLEEEIGMYEFGINLLKFLFSDGNVGFHANDISMRYSCIAFRYARMKNAEKSFEALEECVKYSIIASGDDREFQYTAPMVNRLKNQPKNHTKNYKGNACNIRLRSLGQDCYDFIREDERFKKIVRTLEEHAEQITE